MKPTPKQIETVAEVLYRRWYNVGWDREPDPVKDDIRADARAAIAKWEQIRLKVKRKGSKCRA